MDKKSPEGICVSLCMTVLQNPKLRMLNTKAINDKANLLTCPFSIQQNQSEEFRVDGQKKFLLGQISLKESFPTDRRNS